MQKFLAPLLICAAAYAPLAHADVAVYGAPGVAAWNTDVVNKLTVAAGGSLVH